MFLLIQVVVLSSYFGYNTGQIGIKNAAAISDFNFAAAGDWGCKTATSNTVNNIVSKNTELTLALGDYSYASTADCWFSIISPIDAQTRINIGNHDTVSASLLNQYMNHFHLTKQYYSFDYQNVHVLTMSTEVPFGTTSEQYNFVQNDLASAASNPNIKWIIVNFHRAMYLSDGGYGTSSSLKGYYHALFDQYNVDLVLNGHQHAYERTFPIKYNNADPSKPIVTDSSQSSYNDPQGEIFATVGTGGDSIDNTFLNKAPFAATQFFKFGFLNIDVMNGGSTMKATFYANDDTTGDQFTIVKSTLRSTATKVYTNPSFVAVGRSISYTGQVFDRDISPKQKVFGTLEWNDGGMGGTFSINGNAATSCTLSVYSSESSICKITYKPSSSATVGTVITINAVYSGDHKTSSGTSKLTVLRATSTTISPSTAAVAPAANQLYKVTITDTTSTGTKSAPSGTVSWKASVSGGNFDAISCTLVSIGASQSTCQVTYTAPSTASTITITATYNGDSLHVKSSGRATMTVA